MSRKEEVSEVSLDTQAAAAIVADADSWQETQGGVYRGGEGRFRVITRRSMEAAEQKGRDFIDLGLSRDTLRLIDGGGTAVQRLLLVPKTEEKAFRTILW